MDMNLSLIIDTYALFAQYNIFIPKDDYDKVDSLQLAFNKMLENVSIVRHLLDSIIKSFSYHIQISCCRLRKPHNVSRTWRAHCCAS